MADGLPPNTREYTLFCAFGGMGGVAYGAQLASVTLPGFGVTGRFRVVGGLDVDADSCATFELLTGVKQTCGDAKTLTPEQLVAAAGGSEDAPDVVVITAPCKAATGLINDAKAAEQKYLDLNRLALDFLEVMLVAWRKPPRLVLFENVRGITRDQRGGPMLREVRRLLRGAGYALQEQMHDAGELGGLAQHRQRWLMVARHRKSVPALLYQPPRREVRACGEELGKLPLPGDPSAGPMHTLPEVQTLTWARLAAIRPGHDWHDLQNPPPRYSVAALPTGRVLFNTAWALNDWRAPAGTVTCGNAPSNSQSAADPRLAAEGYPHTYGVLCWSAAAHTVTGANSAGMGPVSVALASFARKLCEREGLSVPDPSPALAERLAQQDAR